MGLDDFGIRDGGSGSTGDGGGGGGGYGGVDFLFVFVFSDFLTVDSTMGGDSTGIGCLELRFDLVCFFFAAFDAIDAVGAGWLLVGNATFRTVGFGVAPVDLRAVGVRARTRCCTTLKL